MGACCITAICCALIWHLGPALAELREPLLIDWRWLDLLTKHLPVHMLMVGPCPKKPRAN